MPLSPEFSKYLPPFEAVHGRQAAAPNVGFSVSPAHAITNSLGKFCSIAQVEHAICFLPGPCLKH